MNQKRTVIISVVLSIFFLMAMLWFFLKKDSAKSTPEAQQEEAYLEEVPQPTQEDFVETPSIQPLLEDETDIVPQLPPTQDTIDEEKVMPYPGDIQESNDDE